MKRKLIFCLLIFFLFIHSIYAEEKKIIQYTNTVSMTEEMPITEIIGDKEAYYVLSTDNENTQMAKYTSENKLISSKKLTGLSSPKVIKRNEELIIIGKDRNSIKIYVLDKNLKIQSQNAPEIIISSQADINLYKEENTIFIMLTKNNLLESNQIYEVDEALNIKSQNLSSYDPSFLREIFHGDYDLIHNNGQLENNEITNYLNTTYNGEKNILIGYKEKENMEKVAILSMIDKETKIEEIKEYTNYNSFKEIEIVNDKFIVLATKHEEDYLVIINALGTIEKEEKLEIPVDKMFKIGNQLVIKSRNTNNLLFYEYNLNIKINTSPYGTIEVPESALPYENVSVEIKPNAGYEIDTILIKDQQGQVLSVTNTKEFTMPENDVTISVTYKEEVKNPETIDIIRITFFVFLGIIGILYICKRKLHWLK